MTPAPHRDGGDHDAVVVGSGPNGLAAAIEIARAGRSVLVLERAGTIGGGTRSEELTLPGYVHDVCSSIHAMAPVSPFLRGLPLHEHGLEWVVPAAPLAHPLDDGSAVILERSLDATAERLGADGARWVSLFGPVVDAWEKLEGELLGPIVHLPRAPFALARFGAQALLPATSLARLRFRTEAGALFAGVAAHSVLPLEKPATSAVGLVLTAAAHIGGWPFPRGGAQALADALAAHLLSLGGEIRTGVDVRSLDDVPPAGSPPRRDAAPVARHCRRSPPRPLRAAAHAVPVRARPLQGRLGAVGADPVAVAGRGARRDRPPRRNARGARPIGARPVVGPARRRAVRPAHTAEPLRRLAGSGGNHTAWAYCHVPNGSTADLTGAIERQVERYAPGFRDVVLARASSGPAELERRNPNLVGGDVNGGAQLLWQLVSRPALRLVPYTTPLDGVYLCSASTPPGGGVHGMCGQLAAQAALRRELR